MGMAHGESSYPTRPAAPFLPRKSLPPGEPELPFSEAQRRSLPRLSAPL